MLCDQLHKSLYLIWVNIGLAIFIILSSSSLLCWTSSSSTIEGNWSLIAPESSFLHHMALQIPHTPDNPYSYEQIDKLRGKYKLEDFLWTGSGDGPLPSEPDDGGLAWEENGAYINGGPATIVLVTKTMVLFKTIITTVYPIELTPTVVTVTPTLNAVTSTPIDSPSLYSSSYLTSYLINSTEDVSVEPTPTIEISPTTATLQIIEVTSSIKPPIDESTTLSSHEEMPTPAHDLQPDEASYLNHSYWVNTIIKANGSSVQGEFQNEMQKNLAQVYASVFKRHLLSSLGVLNINATSNETSVVRRRNKRSSRWKDFSRDELDFQWLLLRDTGMSVSQIKSLATAVMNVSVSIVNITTDDQQPHVSMDYVVAVEGSPVPAVAAVQDLHLITKREMEKQIGYEIIQKAEPLIKPIINESHVTEGAGTSPWLIVAITTICLLVVLIFVLIYMVWKWKHNRLGDTTIRARPQSGIEGGVINPAFLGPPSPIERSVPHRERSSPSSSITVKTEKDVHKIQKADEKRRSKSTSRRVEEQRQIALASDLEKHLGEQKTYSSPSSNGSQRSHTSEESFGKGEKKSHRHRHHDLSRDVKGKDTRKKTEKSRLGETEVTDGKSPSSQGISAKSTDMAERRQRRKTQVVSLKEAKEKEGKDDGSRVTMEEIKDDDQQYLRPSSASRDKITYGHLDLTEESVARSMSDEAKKLLQKSKHKATASESSSMTGSSASEKTEKEPRRTKAVHLPQTIDEISDKWSDDEESLEGISENLEQQSIEARRGRSTKDAQVQTPTRIKKHPKVKTKAKSQPSSSRRPSKLSTESLLSTESEEIIEIREIESSSEANPLGKMRKRFHQFLDDAFNVIGKRESEVDESRAKSAKVSVSHEIETQEHSRPWTSQTIHEESIEQFRPKSATSSVIIPPKRAWTAGTQRRCQSASSSKAVPHHLEAREEQEEMEDSEKCDLTSTVIQSSSAGTQSNILSFSTPIFPGYPVYPDIPLPDTQPGTSQVRRTDPAVPLIEAIKLEIKRFDKEKEKQDETKH